MEIRERELAFTLALKPRLHLVGIRFYNRFDFLDEIIVFTVAEALRLDPFARIELASLRTGEVICFRLEPFLGLHQFSNLSVNLVNTSKFTGFRKPSPYTTLTSMFRSATF